MSARLTTEEFVAKAVLKHKNEQYDYTKVEYINSHTKITIVCPKHGDFQQIPNNHLSGKGCGKCGIKSVTNDKRSSTDEFIARAKMIHPNNIYDYSKVKYRNRRSKVIIVCPKHGDFQQSPRNHLSGSGCGKCGGTQKSDTDEFIARAKMIHPNNIYDYSKVEYLDRRSKVIIVCPKHGDFQQTPDAHLRGKGSLGGSGCVQCGIESVTNDKRSSTDEFIAKAKLIHPNNIYDYSKVKYLDRRTKVIIVCPKHGDFQQSPSNHLNGNGCRKCDSSKGEYAVRSWLEKHEYQFQEQVRFQSCKNIKPLPFDFGIGAKNHRLIEFHGKQHYEPFSFRSKKDTQAQMEANLARVQLHDAIKAKWCEDNNVPLLVIPYWDKHRIPELLEEFLGKASMAAV